MSANADSADPAVSRFLDAVWMERGLSSNTLAAYRYYVREGVLREDPTAQIAMPKIGRSLPRSLTEEEVELLLSAPVVSDPLGNRDRTMLEVLYATGLRVSELVNLRQSQINLNQGVIRILGKGDRERLIPLGEEAMKALKEFARGPRGGARQCALATQT